MTMFDYVLMILAACVLIYQVQLLIRGRRSVTIRGEQLNRGTVMVLVLVLLALVIVRTPNLAQSWPVLLIVILACVTTFFSACGLSDEGMFVGGTFISFRQASYYQIESKNDGSIRFTLSRLTREGHMKIDSAQEQAIVELMEEKNIPTFAEYQHKTAKRIETRAAAKQKKKKRK